jgi:hypothetical protein
MVMIGDPARIGENRNKDSDDPPAFFSVSDLYLYPLFGQIDPSTSSLRFSDQQKPQKVLQKGGTVFIVSPRMWGGSKLSRNI